MGEPDDDAFDLAPEVRERGLRYGIVDGVFANAMFTICSGAILVALALYTGMSDFEYGLLAAMPFLTQLVQVPAGLIYRRFQNRKRVTIAFATAGRLCVFIVAAAVLVFPPELRVAGIFLGLFGWSALTAVASGSWLWWMRDLVPRERLGRYFGVRGALLLGLSGPVLFGAGIFIDFERGAGGADGERFAFGALYVLAGLFGIGSSVFLLLMPHPRVREDPRVVPLRAALAKPFREPNFRRFLQWMALWGFGATITVPFFPVFLLVDHHLPLTIVTGILVAGIATNVVFYVTFGRLSDRLGNKPVIALAVPVFVAAMAMALLIPDGGPLEIPASALAQVLLSIGSTAADLTCWNLAFKLAKGPETPSYLSGFLLVRAVATGTGPIIGGAIGALTLSARADLGVLQLSHLEFVFIVGAVLIAISARPLALVREEGEAPRSELLRALRAEAAGNSLYPGVRHFALASSYLVAAVVRGEELARGSIPRGRRGK